MESGEDCRTWRDHALAAPLRRIQLHHFSLDFLEASAYRNRRSSGRRGRSSEHSCREIAASCRVYSSLSRSLNSGKGTAMGKKPVALFIGLVWAGIALTGCETCKNCRTPNKYEPKSTYGSSQVKNSSPYTGMSNPVTAPIVPATRPDARADMRSETRPDPNITPVGFSGGTANPNIPSAPSMPSVNNPTPTPVAAPISQAIPPAPTAPRHVESMRPRELPTEFQRSEMPKPIDTPRPADAVRPVSQRAEEIPTYGFPAEQPPATPGSWTPPPPPQVPVAKNPEPTPAPVSSPAVEAMPKVETVHPQQPSLPIPPAAPPMPNVSSPSSDVPQPLPPLPSPVPPSPNVPSGPPDNLPPVGIQPLPGR